MQFNLKTVIRISLLILILGGVVFLISPFLGAMAVGAIVGIVLIPFHERLCGWKFSRRLAALVIVAVFSTVILVPTTFLVVRGTESLVEFLQNWGVDVKTIKEPAGPEQEALEEGMGGILGRTASRLTDALGIHEGALTEFVEASFRGLGGMLTDALRKFLRQAPEFGIGIVILILTVYFMLSDTDRIVAGIQKYSPFSKAKMRKFAVGVVKTSNTVVITNLVGGIVQAIIFAVGALIFKTGSVFLVAFTVFLLSFLPVFGTAPVSLGLALYHFVEGQFSYAVGWIVVGLVGGLADNIVKPYVIGSGVQIHPFLALLTVLGGVLLLGIPGLFIGPFVAGLLTTCLPVLLEPE